MGNMLGIVIFRLPCFSFISFSLAFPFNFDKYTISNVRCLINAIAVTLINFLLPSNRLLSDNPTSSTGTRLFSIPNQDLFM